MIESADQFGERWSTVGVSTNVIDASYNALHDSITYKLLRDKRPRSLMSASDLHHRPPSRW